PEQLAGRPSDGRVDIFALGVILFETICGEAPIALRTGENEMAYVSHNLSEPPRRVSALVPDAPPELDDLLLRMMAKEAEERPASMAEVLVALERLAELPSLI